MKVSFNKKINKNDKKLVKVEILEGEKNRLFKSGDRGFVLEIGVGKKKNLDLRGLMSLTRKIVKKVKTEKFEKIAIDFNQFLFPKVKISQEETASILAQNFEMADYEFDRFKSKKEGTFVSEVVVENADKKIRAGFQKGVVIGEEVNKSRDLSNTPGGDMTPSILAKKAREMVKDLPVKVKVLGKNEMKKLKMGAILGVTEGSEEKPAFIIMEYKGGKEKEKPVVFAGKGITFDTGGLGIKPGQHMLGMHLDMSGGAAAISALSAAARLKIKRNVVALIPAVENMLSGRSYRPGDVLKSMSGQTIEVLHTDAEGRLVLADALTYAERYKPALVVDVATLTGAAAVALGDKASAIFTKDEKLEKRFRKLGELSGDYVWPLPLWKEYEEDIKGNFADWANIHSKFKGEGGAIHAAIFLYQFAKKYPWVHIDIAPRMTESPQDNLSQGSTGTPVRLLVKLLEEK